MFHNKSVPVGFIGKGLFMGTQFSIAATGVVSAAGANVVNTILNTISDWVLTGGGLWAVWGAVVFAGGLKDHNGPQTQSGLWQIVGGGIILAAGLLFRNLH